MFGSVLPLFGTWVGTILAFYFARENFAAATESTLRLTGQLTPETPVSDAMIPRAAMVVHQLTVGEGEADVRLRALVDKMQSTGFKRIPEYEHRMARPCGVIHESLILSSRAIQVGGRLRTIPSSGESLADSPVGLLTLGALSEAIAFVDKRARVRDARERMRAKSGSNDVFVTETGAPNEPVVGGITNTLLAGAE